MSVKCSCGRKCLTLKDFYTHCQIQKSFRSSCLTHTLDITDKETIKTLRSNNNKFMFLKGNKY